MSTISKLDVVTRRSRKDRKALLETMARDARFLALSGKPNESALCTAVLDHLTKVCKDPKRSGATKDAILRKLGAQNA